MAATEVVKLDNFDAPLQGYRLLFYYDSITAALPGIFDSALHGEAYSRRVLLTAPSSRTSSLFRAEWDAIFQPADQKEWSLILTYCLYTPKPICIVVDDQVSVPEAFYQRLPQNTTTLIIKPLDSVADPALSRHDAVFYPPIADITSVESANLIRSITSLTASTTSVETKKAWLRELRVAKAALVWTRIGESTPAGAVYWYDILDGPASLKRTPPALIANHMRTLAAQLTPA